MKRKMILILTGEHNYCMKLLNHKYNNCIFVNPPDELDFKILFGEEN